MLVTSGGRARGGDARIDQHEECGVLVVPCALRSEHCNDCREMCEREEVLGFRECASQCDGS